MQRKQAEPENSSLRDVRVGENRTGMPDSLLSGLEELSGIDLSRVRVRYNSPEPARLDALAYTQGNDIVLAPGQEKHLPHEGWHVVQQMQARVKPTTQMKGTLLNDDDGLEREADVMGTKALALGKQAQTADFGARLGSATGETSEDEPFVANLNATAQRRASLSTKPGTTANPVVQRVATFVPGTVSSTTNLASHVIAGRRDMGFTPPTLNGTAILSATTAQLVIRTPTLAGRSNADGTISRRDVDVATNEASFTMQLPSAGPWSTVTTKANAVALFSSVGLTPPAACSAAGNTTFSFRGRPTDADFAANVRTHEDLHAADHQAGFTAIIVPGDTRLEAAKTVGTWFNGPTEADADAALFTAMGGTPNQIATAQHNDWIRRNNLTHGGTTLATGGSATPSNPAADATCSTSSVDPRN